MQPNFVPKLIIYLSLGIGLIYLEIIQVENGQDHQKFPLKFTKDINSIKENLDGHLFSLCR